MTPAMYCRWDSRGEPTGFQGSLNGFDLTWNPDDERFHVVRQSDGLTQVRFKHWRNATRYARTHLPKETAK